MTGTYTLFDVRQIVDRLWPAATAETWDRVGLVTGRNTDTVSTVLLAVDPVRATVDEAIELGADLLLTHHPLMLRGVHSVAEDTYKGALVSDLIRAGVALLSAHTNADAPERGVSDEIARALSLRDTEPLVPGVDPTSGLGRVGELPETMTLRSLAEQLTSILPETAVGARVAGDPQRIIRRVALLGGAGDSLLGHSLVRSADVYITSDLRHHPAQEAVEEAMVSGGPALIDVPHWASESVWLTTAARQLEESLPGLRAQVSHINTDPWTFHVGHAR